METSEIDKLLFERQSQFDEENDESAENKKFKEELKEKLQNLKTRKNQTFEELQSLKYKPRQGGTHF